MCMVADIGINVNLLYGFLFFGVAHIFFCIAFYLEKPPVRWQILFWLIFTVLGWCLVFFFKEKAAGLLVPALLYVCILLAMLALALRQKFFMLAGAIVFVISDFLLGRNLVLGKTPLSHFVSLGAYYVALILLALVPWYSDEHKTE